LVTEDASFEAGPEWQTRTTPAPNEEE